MILSILDTLSGLGLWLNMLQVPFTFGVTIYLLTNFYNQNWDKKISLRIIQISVACVIGSFLSILFIAINPKDGGLGAAGMEGMAYMGSILGFITLVLGCILYSIAEKKE